MISALVSNHQWIYLERTVTNARKKQMQARHWYRFTTWKCKPARSSLENARKYNHVFITIYNLRMQTYDYHFICAQLHLLNATRYLLLCTYIRTKLENCSSYKCHRAAFCNCQSLVSVFFDSSVCHHKTFCICCIFYLSICGHFCRSVTKPVTFCLFFWLL